MKKFLSLIVVLFSTVTLWGMDVTGNWEGLLKWGEKSFPVYLTLKQDGATCSGMVGPEKENDRKSIQDCKIEASTLHFRAPGGDGSGTDLVVAELQLQNDELTGTLQGKDRTGQMQTYTLSLKRPKAQ